MWSRNSYSCSVGRPFTAQLRIRPKAFRPSLSADQPKILENSVGIPIFDALDRAMFASRSRSDCFCSNFVAMPLRINDSDGGLDASFFFRYHHGVSANSA